MSATGPNRPSPAFLRELTRLLGPQACLSDPADLRCYAFDLFARGLPDVVALPATPAQVSAVLTLAQAEGVAVTPRGAATSLTGGPVPVSGGVALGLARMAQVLEVSPEDRLARAQAGVVTLDLRRAVEARGLYYPPDPTSMAYCTLGGNVATNAGGAAGVKYGVTRDYLLGLTVALPGGEVLSLGGRCPKRVTGYDFTRLVCGSEGQLAVVLDATVRLLPRPRSVQTLLACFPDVEAAALAALAALASGATPCTLELMDDGFLTSVNALYALDLPPGTGAALLLEADGREAEAARDMDALEDACRGAGAVSLERASDPARRDALWRARRGGTAALARGHKFMISLDFAVPLSRLGRAVRLVQAQAARHGVRAAVIGHAGDGNIHPMFLFDPDDPAQAAAYQALEESLCREFVALGGTLSGEHGIGLEKAARLPLELADPELALSRRVKRAFDPAGILNPGKCEWACDGPDKS